MAPAGPHGLQDLAEDTRDEEEAGGWLWQRAPKTRSSRLPPGASTKWRQGLPNGGGAPAGKMPARCQGRCGGHNDWHITAPRRGRPSAAAVPAVAPLPSALARAGGPAMAASEED